MKLSPAQQDLLQQFNVTVESGLTTDEAFKRREDSGTFNVVDPPVQCPAWICCLLPCIKHIPSMKAFRNIQVEDAEVKRNGEWIRYDASSLVVGDIIRMEEGDHVPADCTVLALEEDVDELLVEHRSVTGEEQSRSALRKQELTPPLQLFWGGRVTLGSCLAVVTAIGPNTLVAGLIREDRFPPKTNVIHSTPDTQDEEAGISLIPSNRSSSRMT